MCVGGGVCVGCVCVWGGVCVLEDRTTLNQSTIDVMVDSPSKKTKACTIQVVLLCEFVSSEGGYL